MRYDMKRLNMYVAAVAVRWELNLFKLQMSKVKTSLGYIGAYDRKAKNKDITRIFLSQNLDFLVDNCDVDIRIS